MYRNAWAALCGLLVLATAPAAPASVVRRLSPDELARGADAVVEGTVRAVESSWNRTRTGLQTRITVDVARVVRGRIEPVTGPVTEPMTGPMIEIIQPGGEIAGNRHIIVGLPSFTPGEPVRLYLRRNTAPMAGYRVYGWSQGKWLGRDAGGGLEYAPGPDSGPDSGIDSGPGSGTAGILYYTHNGMVWPASAIPVPYLTHASGSDDVSLAAAQAAIRAAFATWEAVPCSTLAYRDAGETADLGVAIDGQNVILWIEDGWIYGAEAAAATSLWIPIEAERTADVAFNGEGFSWAVAPEAAISFSTLDIQAVLTHELGHFSGLGHTESAVDTMYYSWRPWPGQRTLSVDDKLGLCALYPQQAGQPCAECTAGDECAASEYGTLCTTPAEPAGAPCSYRRIECEDFCLFTAVDLSAGYCSRFCEQQSDCPAGFVCAAASAGAQSVKACFVDPDGPDAGPDAGPGPGTNPCATGGDCPAGRYCGADNQCTYDCLQPIDCAGGAVCSERGQCMVAAGGGCRVGAPGRVPSWPALVLIPFALFWLRLSRRAPGRL